jgi:hypothetical protein
MDFAKVGITVIGFILRELFHFEHIQMLFLRKTGIFTYKYPVRFNNNIFIKNPLHQHQ